MVGFNEPFELEMIHDQRASKPFHVHHIDATSFIQNVLWLWTILIFNEISTLKTQI